LYQFQSFLFSHGYNTNALGEQLFPQVPVIGHHQAAVFLCIADHLFIDGT
jgi:hypothetical protein